MNKTLFYITGKTEAGETPIINTFTGELGTAHEYNRIFAEDYYTIARYNYAVFFDGDKQKTLYGLFAFSYFENGTQLKTVLTDFDTGERIITDLLHLLLVPQAATPTDIKKAIKKEFDIK